MKRIVGIGACVADTLVSVPRYPAEDTKLRADGVRAAGGGPTATGLVAAAKLGVPAAYIGTLADEAGGRFLLADFVRYGLPVDLITVRGGYRSFTSFVLLAEDRASRTCVFDKGDLPPLALNDAQKAAIRDAALLMVDGNEMAAAVEGAKIARAAGVPVLYDCGGLYEGVENLLALTDVMIPSEEFALRHTGETDARRAAQALMKRYGPRVVVITQGARGGILFDGTRLVPYPIYPAKVVDSNGAGDVFHGAFAAGMCKGFGWENCCHFASAASALKCTGVGARESVPDFETVKHCLLENNHEL